MLPKITENKILPAPHFPNRMYAVIFRLWETVKAEKIAEGLNLSLDTVTKAARDMGLGQQKNMDIWEKRGYITTIRNMWNLLPYEQMLKVLGWTQEKLEFVLKEEDFLDCKLGIKPDCEPVKEEPLTPEGKEQLAAIRHVMEEELSGLFSGVPAFDFFSGEKPTGGGKQPEGLRAIYSYCGLYSNVLDEDIEVSYPDALLEAYRNTGVNAVWLPVLLYQMIPFDFDESYSVGWEGRQERLRSLIDRCKKYGIQVYLYLNEPRCMPIAFFKHYPELQGFTKEREASLCTSQPAVVENLRNSVERLCSDVPGIGGLILITQSENLTHCKSRGASEGSACPRCAETPTYELIARSVNAIYDGAKKANPDINVIAWNWAWFGAMNEEESRKCIDLLPKDIILQANGEYQEKFSVDGIDAEIRDYSIARPGPSQLTKNFWNYAKETGRGICAKVQLNTTWECSTVPAMPVFDLIRKRMQGLKKEGVDNIMMSWTLGGMPSVNLKVANAYLEDSSEEAYDKFLAGEYGENAAKVKEAARIFSEAFENFLPETGVLYRGPQNAGPSTLLYPEPTGFDATMTCFAYDDLEHWRAIFPKETLQKSFEKISTRWRDGLAIIEDMPDCQFKQMAWAGYLLMYSSYLQITFVLEREKGNREELLKIARAERDNAVTMYNLMQKNATIGYEAANHYYYNKGMLAEKVINCNYLIQSYLKK